MVMGAKINVRCAKVGHRWSVLQRSTLIPVCGNCDIFYLLVTAIIKVTATTEINIPVMIFDVSASPKTTVPTRIAVIGSKTPNTEAFVAPIFLVAIAKVAVETIVGRIASPIRFVHAIPDSSPVMRSAPDIEHLVKKTTVPTSSA